MHHLCSSRFTAALALLAAGTAAAPAEIGRYCLRENLQGYDGRQTFGLGLFNAELSVENASTGSVASFTDKMPDAGQMIEILRVPLIQENSGIYSISFVDNFLNRGTASLQFRPGEVTIHFGEIKSADPIGANATRGYGDFTLTRAACLAGSPG